jgi:hypothetical protein
MNLAGSISRCNGSSCSRFLLDRRSILLDRQSSDSCADRWHLLPVHLQRAILLETAPSNKTTPDAVSYCCPPRNRKRLPNLWENGRYNRQLVSVHDFFFPTLQNIANGCFLAFCACNMRISRVLDIRSVVTKAKNMTK